jgi:hypothetical protein
MLPTKMNAAPAEEERNRPPLFFLVPPVVIAVGREDCDVLMTVMLTKNSCFTATYVLALSSSVIKEEIHKIMYSY